MKKYKVVIVGGGIAGLATGEIFARSGFQTLLIEKNDKLCMETSGLHHEWFHAGSLYAVFPNKQFFRTMVGGIEDVLDYYRDFEGMNLRVDGNGKLIKKQCENEWFRPENLEYVIATTRNEDFSFKNIASVGELPHKFLIKLAWRRAIKRFISRHNRFCRNDWRTGCAARRIARSGWFDYSDHNLTALLNDELNLDSSSHLTMQSFDCPMNAMNIISDLLKSFIANGGELLTGNEFVGYEKIENNQTIIVTDKETFEAHKLIFASGKALRQQANGVFEVKSIISPLLVVSPRICSVNTVRLSPFIEQTINHLGHTVDGHEYSVIGGGYFAPTDDGNAINRAGNMLIEKAESIFPRMANAQLTRLYFGTKTEIMSSQSERNYLYKIQQIENNVFAVVPGTFSLAFSLAVNAFKQITGSCPQTFSLYYSKLDVERFIALTKHRTIIKEFLASEFDSQKSPEVNVVDNTDIELVS